MGCQALRGSPERPGAFVGKTGVGAVSTIKLLDLANSQGSVIYDATSSNWTTISPLIDYENIDKNEVITYIAAGYRVVLPANGKLTQGDWTGAGYIGFKSGVLQQLTYKISSNLKGGYTDFYIVPDFYVPVAVLTAEYVWPPTQVTTFDPIDLFAGAFLYDHDDLVIGSADFPIGLGFRRSYNSNNLYATGPLGPGWTHGFSINAASNSDGLKGMGQDSPIDGAAFIAAAYVVQDLFKEATKPLDKVVIASLVQKWAMDRLIDNTVNVTTGSQGEQFVLLADSTYNPQPGSSSRLSLSGGAYTLRYKDGTALLFDSAGDISTWQTPAGVTVSFAYEASSPPRLVSVSNNLGRSLNLQYNTAGQLVSVSDNSSPSRKVSYAFDAPDASGKLVSATDPLGKTTTFTYSAAAGGTTPPRLLHEIFFPANPTAAFVTNVYDTLGRVATQTSANRATWSYFFAGYRSEEDDPDGIQHVLYYTPRGKVQLELQDAANLRLVSRFAYDGLDRLTSTTLPEGGSTSYAYQGAVNPWANNVATVTRNPKPGSPLSPTTTTYAYDATFNKPTSVTDALGRITAMTYAPSTGNLESVVADSTDLQATARFTYNAVGLPLTSTDPLGVVTQYTYDSHGNRTSVVVDPGPGRLNQTTTSTYNSRGDVVSATDANGNASFSSWDDNRRLLTAALPPTGATGGPGSVIVSSTWTTSGKTATTTDANGNVTRYAYDKLDRQSSVTDAVGRTTLFTYDTLGRPYRTYNAALPFTPLVTRTYTADGKLAALTEANGNTTSFAYDGFDRLAAIAYPLGTSESFTYDALDNRLSRTTRAGATIAYAYDTLNRLTDKTPPTGPAAKYTYDLAGRMLSASDLSAAMTRVAPPGGVNTVYATHFTYDPLNRLLGVTWDPAPAAATPPSSPKVTFTQTYNQANQRTGQSVDDSSWIDYPPVSSTSYTANALNQYATVGAVTPTYDANGNLTSDGTWSYGYDAENRLVSASSAGNSVAYAYDAQGRRKSRTVSGTTTSTTIFVTDPGNREVLEYNGAAGAGSGTVLSWYANGLGPNAVLGQMNVSPGPATRSTPVPDQLGSIIASLDAATGLLSKFSYRPFGDSTTPPTSQYGFTGQRLDAEAGGLYYYRARHYSPALGRFLQTDPIGHGGGINLYAYAANDPLNLLDPDGLSVRKSVENFSGGQQILSDATPDPILPGAQHAQALSLCAGGPIPCAAGVGITAGQALMGLGLSGAATTGVIILNQDQTPKDTDLKKLSPGEIKNLENNGVDVHELKGGKATGQLDLFKDKTGKIYILPKSGRGEPDPTGLNTKDFQ